MTTVYLYTYTQFCQSTTPPTCSVVRIHKTPSIKLLTKLIELPIILNDHALCAYMLIRSYMIKECSQVGQQITNTEIIMKDNHCEATHFHNEVVLLLEFSLRRFSKCLLSQQQ